MTRGVKWAGAGKLLLIIASAFWTGTALGQPGLEMEVLPAFDGHVKEGHWLAVTSVIENTGPRVRGTIEVATEGLGRATTFTTRVDLPRRSRRAYTLYVLNEGFAATGKLKVRLRATGRRPMDREAQLRSHTREERIVAVIGAGASSLIALSGLWVPAVPPPTQPTDGSSGPYPTAMTMPAMGRTHLVLHDTEQESVGGGAGLPTRVRGYDSVDVVVLRDFRPARLSPEEVDALIKWVASGGTLVVSAGGSAQAIQGSFVEKMLPVTLRGAKTLTGLSGLAERYHVAPPRATSVLVTHAAQQSGTVLASQDGVPLIVEGRHGMGRVYFLAFDVGREPARSWAAGMTELWREILTAPDTTWRLPEDAWTAAGGQWANIGPYGGPQSGPAAQTLADAVRWIPQMEVPSFGFVGAFLVLYILFLVPINYFVLKALDKRELSWITTPLIVVVFSVGAYMIGRSVKGGKVLVTQAAVVQARPGSSTAVADDFIGIFSPSRTRYDVTMKDRHATVMEAVANPNAASLSRMGVLQQETLSTPGLHIDMWDMKVLHSQGVLDLGKGILAHAHLTADGKIEGQITNNTPYALEQCLMIHGAASISIGTVAPRDSAKFSVTTEQLSKGGSGVQATQLLPGGRRPARQDDMQSQIRHQTANALIGPGRQLLGRTPRNELLVVGWIAGARRNIIGLRPDSDDEAHAAALALRIPVQVTGSQFRIPRQLTTACIREASQTGSVDYGQDGAIHLSSGWFEADIRLPISGSGIVADSASIKIDHKGGSIKLSVWDDMTSRWQPSRNVKSDGDSIDVRNPQRVLCLPQGVIRVRIEKPGEGDEAEIRGLGAEVRGRQG